MNLIEIYNDSIDFAKSEGFRSNTTKFTFGDIIKTINSSNSSLDNVAVLDSDTVSMLVVASKLGKTAILNMASPKRPGGGVDNGAMAQEESLFRCSNLGLAISSEHYPLAVDECLWTDDAYFFKDHNYGYMKEVKCDVISIAAPNLNLSIDWIKEESVRNDVIKNKIRLMLSISWIKNVDNIILGAWGCGVFGNDPTKMANLFKEVLQEGYASMFSRVIFAIINDHNSVSDNYSCFKEVFDI